MLNNKNRVSVFKFAEFVKKKMKEAIVHKLTKTKKFSLSKKREEYAIEKTNRRSI